jgi:hypothetical protein
MLYFEDVSWKESPSETLLQIRNNNTIRATIGERINAYKIIVIKHDGGGAWASLPQMKG